MKRKRLKDSWVGGMISTEVEVKSPMLVYVGAGHLCPCSEGIALRLYAGHVLQEESGHTNMPLFELLYGGNSGDAPDPSRNFDFDT